MKIEGLFMEKLSYYALLESYIKAQQLGLAKVFIHMIKEEINKRGITEGEIKAFRNTYIEIKEAL